MDVNHDLNACDLDKYFQFPYSIAHLKINCQEQYRPQTLHTPTHTYTRLLVNHCHSHHIRPTVRNVIVHIPTANCRCNQNQFIYANCVCQHRPIYSRVRVKHIGKLIHECNVITLISEHIWSPVAMMCA